MIEALKRAEAGGRSFEIDEILFFESKKLLSRINKEFSLENILSFFLFALSKIEKGYILYHIKKEKNDESDFPLIEEADIERFFESFRDIYFGSGQKIAYNYSNDYLAKKKFFSKLQSVSVKLSRFLKIPINASEALEAAILFYYAILQIYAEMDYYDCDNVFCLMIQEDKRKEKIYLERKDLFNPELQ